MILAIEILALVSTAVLAILRIIYTEFDWTPYIIGSGAIFTVSEIGRRLLSSRNKSTQIEVAHGGRGGSAKVGENGIAIGGQGGRSGTPGSGAGGDGGNAEVNGDGIAVGGEGGEAGQSNRGGRGGRSPLEVLGIPNTQLPDGRWLWEFGRGGDGAPQVNPDQNPKKNKPQQ